jgi:WD40 repeat protein
MSHPDELKSVIFSPDGESIASFSDEVHEGIVKVRDKTGALKHILGGRENVVTSVAFSPNCALIAIGFRSSTVTVLETDTWALYCRLDSGSLPEGLAFSSGEKQPAAGCWSNMVNVWQLSTGTLRSMMRGHSSSVNCVAFSPDGRLIASGSSDSTVKVWDASIGTSPERNQNAHTGEVRAVRLSPDRREVASHADSTVRLWNASTGDLQRVISNDETGNEGFLYFYTTGTLLLSMGGNATEPINWDAVRGILARITFPNDLPEYHNDAHLSPDGKIIVYDSRTTLEFGDTTSQKSLYSVEPISLCYFCAKFVFSPSSALVATYSADPFEGRSINRRGETKEREAEDRKTLTRVREDRKITVHNAKIGAIQSVLCGHPDPTRIVKFSPDDRFVASVSFDGTVRLWTTATGDLEHYLQHSRPISAVAFTQNTTTLASLSVRDNALKFWDTAPGTLQYTLPSVDEVKDLVSFSEDGKFLTTNRGSIDIEASRAKGTCVLRHDSVSVEEQSTVLLEFKISSTTLISPLDCKYILSSQLLKVLPILWIL